MVTLAISQDSNPDYCLNNHSFMVTLAMFYSAFSKKQRLQQRAYVVQPIGEEKWETSKIRNC